MCRLNEQLALCTSVKFKAFRPTAKGRLDEEINRVAWGLAAEVVIMFSGTLKKPFVENGLSD